MIGLQLIGKERLEQITKHGIDFSDDIANNSEGQLVTAAERLLIEEPLPILIENPPKGWNKMIWRRLMRKLYTDRLVIAGALIAAELDRRSGLIELQER